MHMHTINHAYLAHNHSVVWHGTSKLRNALYSKLTSTLYRTNQAAQAYGRRQTARQDLVAEILPLPVGSHTNTHKF